MKFTHVKEFKEFILEHSMLNVKETKVTKNAKTREKKSIRFKSFLHVPIRFRSFYICL